MHTRARGCRPSRSKCSTVCLIGDDNGVADGISATQYQSAAKVSKATTTRHLGDLVEKGYLLRLSGGGRSTRYQVNIDVCARRCRSIDDDRAGGLGL